MAVFLFGVCVLQVEKGKPPIFGLQMATGSDGIGWHIDIVNILAAGDVSSKLVLAGGRGDSSSLVQQKRHSLVP